MEGHERRGKFIKWEDQWTVNINDTADHVSGAVMEDGVFAICHFR